MYLNAPVGGTVEFMGDKLTLGSGAVISGDLIYTSPKKATMEEGAVVRGETTYTESKDTRSISKTGLAALLSLAFFGMFLTQFACALLPRPRVQTLRDDARRKCGHPAPA